MHLIIPHFKRLFIQASHLSQMTAYRSENTFICILIWCWNTLSCNRKTDYGSCLEANILDHVPAPPALIFFSLTYWFSFPFPELLEFFNWLEGARVGK